MIKLKYIPEANSPSNFHTLIDEISNKHFGHCWINGEGWGEFAGKWTFNRGSLPILYNYWPEIYEHDSLESLIKHLEETFPEKPLPEPN